MPAKFEGLGLQFQYPENWTLDDSDALLGRKSVTVYSPGGAFWSVAVHFGLVDPAKLTKAVVDTMRREYAAVESEEASEIIAGHALERLRSEFLLLGFDQYGTDPLPASRPHDVHDFLPGRRQGIQTDPAGVSGHFHKSCQRIGQNTSTRLSPGISHPEHSHPEHSHPERSRS